MDIFFHGNPVKQDYLNYIDSPYSLSLIAYMRDIHLGRGEYYTSYMMLECLLEKKYYNIFESIFKRFFYIKDEHPYGSYKDIKYFCDYIRIESSIPNKREIYHYIIRNFIKPQLEIDKTSSNPSLLAKWLPREKSKFGWLAKEIAWCCYDENYDLISYSLQKYRKDIADINRRLETPQINMANGTWSKIKEFRGATLRLHERAFMSNKNEDREECSKHFNEKRVAWNYSLATPPFLVKL